MEEQQNNPSKISHSKRENNCKHMGSIIIMINRYCWIGTGKSPCPAVEEPKRLDTGFVSEMNCSVRHPPCFTAMPSGRFFLSHYLCAHIWKWVLEGMFSLGDYIVFLVGSQQCSFESLEAFIHQSCGQKFCKILSKFLSCLPPIISMFK